MPEDRTVLDHLLEGREALQRDMVRLTAAIEQLDSVIGLLGATDESSAASTNTSETVSGPLEVKPVTASSRPRSRRAGTTTTTTTQPPKSIRVHVLEMLQAEEREFGLAEIIDRVHDAGIRAHDDAVRSITIKLMKDGRVERVGRGQYRLARPAPLSFTTAPPAEPAMDEPQAAPPEPHHAPSLNLGQPWSS